MLSPDASAAGRRLPATYLYQLVENKQRFISQIMTGKSPARSAEDIDEASLSYAEIKALATGNPLIKERMDLSMAVERLKLLKSSYLSQKYAMEDNILKYYPQQIRFMEERIRGYQADMARLAEQPTMGGDEKFPPMLLSGQEYIVRQEAGAAILAHCQGMQSPEPVKIGSYRGFELELSYDRFAREYRLRLIGQLSHQVTLGKDAGGNISRIDNALAALPERLIQVEQELATLHQQLITAQVEVEKPFAQAAELQEKAARLSELDVLLNLNEHDQTLLDEEPEEDVEDRGRISRQRISATER